MSKLFTTALQNIADGDFSVEQYRKETFLITDPDPIGFSLEILIKYKNGEVILQEKDPFHTFDEMNRMCEDEEEWNISVRDFQYLTEVDPEAIFKIVEILKCKDSEDPEDLVHDIVVMLKEKSSNTLDRVFERITEEECDEGGDLAWKEIYYYE